MPSVLAGEREAAFGFDELFFSRTDTRGKIASGNAVFRRISRYDWDELLGSPHNIIRHPDMPRGVFWLMWDQIRQGRPIGAYVKNRAKDGSAYWVFAIITPVEGGYLSVRLKPGSPLLAQVAAEYHALLAAERDEGLAPAASAQRLLGRLAALGFADYRSFMAKGLMAEVLNRDRQMGARTAPTLRFFDELLTASEGLVGSASRVAGSYQGFRFVPLNLVIQAVRLGSAGRALGTISNNYTLLAGDIRDALDGFSAAAHAVSETISEGAFLLATALMQREIAGTFASEAAEERVDHAREARLLNDQRMRYTQRALDNLMSIERNLCSFVSGTDDIRRLTSGLTAIRMMGKVEVGRLNSGVLNDLVTDLEAFQRILTEGLGEITRMNEAMCRNACALKAAYQTETASVAA
ncbi:hypothetical protein AWJ14_11560 [Hoeflea olei]|uniref:PAS fold-3 domain-containing protein n=2 Tax=Hoeflea olei TaxID=1480615 RepID=A0A1C1YUL5_9HYPH|nr:hypothetical protein AWJ14_11560 [Hoeflea olei]